MRIDPVFVVLGALFFCWGAYLLSVSFLRGGVRHRPLALLWITFSAGLLLQGLAPPLEVRNNAFVVPHLPSQSANLPSIDPAGIVKRERRTRLLVGLLTLGSALGLAYWYRHDLLPSRSAFKSDTPPTPS